MNRVVNIRDLGPRDDWPEDIARIDRLTPYGNPFKISDTVGRDDVIAWYRKWLEGVLAMTPDFLEPLRGRRLACWCAPLPCHGDVIIEMLDKSAPTALESP